MDLKRMIALLVSVTICTVSGRNDVFCQIQANADTYGTDITYERYCHSQLENIIAGGCIECSAGDTVFYPVYLLNNTDYGYSAGGIRMIPDRDLTLVLDSSGNMNARAREAGDSGIHIYYYNKDKNIIAAGLASYNADSDNGRLFTVQFQVPYTAQAGAVYPIRIEVDEWLDHKGNALSVNVYDGWIYIKSDENYEPELPEPRAASGQYAVPSLTGKAQEPPAVTKSMSVLGEPDEAGIRVLKAYSFQYIEPVDGCFYSHDRRTFSLSGQSATLSLAKYYINADGYFCDADGNASGNEQYEENGEIPYRVRPFETKAMDISEYVRPAETENTPSKIWRNEIESVLGKSYTLKQELSVLHTNNYQIGMYYYSNKITDADFIIGTEPVCIGIYDLSVGVKGDMDLNNQVSLADAFLALTVYRSALAQFPYSFGTDEPEWREKLRFFLAIIPDYRGMDDYVTGKDYVTVEDAQYILNYYVSNVLCLEKKEWENIAGVDIDQNPPESDPVQYITETTTTTTTTTTT
ncbi:MAG: hypothetical protein IKQ39_08315, partial [Oscillospiraceae bacterium]|nr:hypothetical protein [Oscillospiraceae bacterium]